MFDLLKIWLTKGSTVDKKPWFKKLDVDTFEKDLSRINQLDSKTKNTLSR